MKQILSNDIINQYLPTLIHCPLFNKLGEPELRGYLHNAKVIVHSYKKNDFIALSGDPMEGIGVILEGSALLTRENVMGQRVIMAIWQCIDKCFERDEHNLGYLCSLNSSRP